MDNPWAAGSSCRTQSEHTGDDWGSRYSGSKMTEGVIQPLWVRPAKRDRRKRGSTTSHHMRGIHQRSNELSRMTWRNDRDYRCSRDQRRHGEETGHRWMIATTCGSFLTTPFVLVKAGRSAVAGALESRHTTLNTKPGTFDDQDAPAYAQALHRAQRQHLPLSVTGAETEIAVIPVLPGIVRGDTGTVPVCTTSGPYRNRFGLTWYEIYRCPTLHHQRTNHAKTLTIASPVCSNALRNISLA